MSALRSKVSSAENVRSLLGVPSLVGGVFLFGTHMIAASQRCVESIDHGTADEEISLSNKVQNHIDAQISNDSVYRFIKPRILGLPECSAP